MKPSVKVCRGQAHAIVCERLVKSCVEGDGAFGRKARVAERAEAKAAAKERAEPLEERGLAVAVAYVRAQLRARTLEEVCD